MNKISPFGKGKDSSLNACVGSNGGPYNYADYAAGYLGVANVFAKQLIDKRGFLFEAPIDVSIYPLLYLYRQGLELMMKHFLLDKTDASKNDKGHNLEKLWIEAKSELNQFFSPILEKGDLDDALIKLEDFILKMHDLDPDGEVMRFPEDLQGNLFLQDYDPINVEPIYEAALDVEKVFESLLEAKYSYLADL